METKEKKQLFLQLQFCMLLLLLTVLPEFKLSALLGSVFGGGFGSSFDFVLFACQVVGVVGGGLALLKLHKAEPLEIPFLAFSGGGMFVVLLSAIPSVPFWLAYIGLIALFIALIMAKGQLKVEWNSWGSPGAYFILLAILLRVFHGIHDTTMTGITALVGLVFYFIGLGKLKSALDDEGAKGISKLKIAIILGIVAIVFGWIPLLGSIVSGILFIIAFIIEYMGYGCFKKSATIGAGGQEGAGKLCTSMIILLVATIVGLIPGLGIAESLLSIVSLWFVFQGWQMILFGLEDEVNKRI